MENSTAKDSTQVSARMESNLLPAQHWATQVHLEEFSDSDSAADSRSISSASSITSSILKYRTIQGRKYHSESGDAQYWGTIDEQQREALDILHHALTLTADGKLYYAPLSKDIKKAVDIGTGTGIWAIDFADDFPDTEVIGTDVSPIQPSWVPSNLKFEIEDCNNEWTFPSGSVDYIHLRWMFGSVSDWTKLFQQAYKCLKPGGYVESFEPGLLIESDDGTVTEDSAMGQWGKFFIEGAKKLERTFAVVDERLQRKGLEEAGFVNIQEVNIKTPLGRWPKDNKNKEIGEYTLLVTEQDLEGFVLFVANTIGWTREEVTIYIAQFRREIRDTNRHGYYRQKVVWAQKPE